LNNSINILSIDLDAFWESGETIYVNNFKKLVPNHLEVLNLFKKLIYKQINYGIDHNEIMQLIDMYPNSKFNIYNYDAHHDLYALYNNIWLNPLLHCRLFFLACFLDYKCVQWPYCCRRLKTRNHNELYL